MKILLVEDDSRTEQLINYAMSEINIEHKLVTVHDGDEAIDLLFNNPGRSVPLEISLVLLDLKLPKVNGTEVLKAIRKHVTTQFLPVIIFTSSEDPKDKERCYQLGANSYVVKPTGFEEFTDCVQTLGRYWLQFNRIITP